MTEYKIEKGIPLPPGRGSLNGVANALCALEPGDSVLFPDLVSTAQVSGGKIQKLRDQGRRFACRKVEGGIRVWRVE